MDSSTYCPSLFGDLEFFKKFLDLLVGNLSRSLNLVFFRARTTKDDQFFIKDFRGRGRPRLYMGRGRGRPERDLERGRGRQFSRILGRGRPGRGRRGRRRPAEACYRL